MSEKLCPFCGEDKLHYIGELKCHHNSYDYIDEIVVLRQQLDVAVAELDYLEPRTDEYVKASIVKTLEEINRIGGKNE